MQEYIKQRQRIVANSILSINIHKETFHMYHQLLLYSIIRKTFKYCINTIICKKRPLAETEANLAQAAHCAFEQNVVSGFVFNNYYASCNAGYCIPLYV